MIDYAARLALVQAAITGLLSGGMQSYEIEGQKVTKLDLLALGAEEGRLVAKLRRQSAAGSGTFRRAVPG
ncbi:MAG: hypothetical protein KBF85_06475 [Tabrizicola sp.]|nr:hypothetical protein [Tabrizicola sp.]